MQRPSLCKLAVFLRGFYICIVLLLDSPVSAEVGQESDLGAQLTISALSVDGGTGTAAANKSALAKPSLSSPKIEHFRMSNGVDVWFVQRRGMGKFGARMVLNTRDRSTCERPAGTAEIMAALITKGTGSRSRSEIETEIVRLGGSLGSFGGDFEAAIEIAARIDNLEEALALWAESIRNPSFNDSEFIQQKSKFAAELEASAQVPREVAIAALDRALSGNCSQFGQVATLQTIARIRRADVKNLYEQRFISGGAFIVAIGDIDAQNLNPKLEAALAGWRPRERDVLSAPRHSPSRSSRVILIDKPGASETQIRAGRIVPQFNMANESAVSLFVAALGQSGRSRIYTNISKQRGWAFFAGVFLRPTQNSRALIAKASEVKIERTQDVISEFRKELDDISDDRAVTSEEVERERVDLLRYFEEFPWENDSATLSLLQTIAQNDLPADYLSAASEALHRTSLKEVRNVGKMLLPDTAMTWIVIGDLSRIEDQIRDLNIGKVEVQDAFGRRLR